MNPFVGVRQVSSAGELRQLLDNPSESSYYFLRWHHKVSGILTQLADFPSPEGQMFNSKIELRWKQEGAGYEVLLLSTVEPDPALGFEAVGSSWEIIDRHAQLYKSTETRFPQGFAHQNVKVAQRYFMDAQTATVHFVALTVSNHD